MGHRILIAPLDWGLGHATRCIPVIRRLKDRGHDVIIAGDGHVTALLGHEFPDVEMTDLAGYGVRYSKSLPMAVHMARSTPRIVTSMRKEHKAVQGLIGRHGIEAIISDNRYGLWSEHLPSVFITHQVQIASPVLEKALHGITSRLINRFDVCWIPDLPGEINLSGKLSHGQLMPDNVRYVGPLSRFERKTGQAGHTYDLAVILSGPEPQRTVFEDVVREQLAASDMKAVVLRGLPDGYGREVEGDVTWVDHLATGDMQDVLDRSGLILSRSGYSTVMDLARLGKNAIFVPTPGETEQEYLALHHKESGLCYAMRQKELDLQKAMEEAKGYRGLDLSWNNDLLDSAISDLETRMNK